MDSQNSPISRRRLLQVTGASVGAIAFGSVLGACDASPESQVNANAKIKKGGQLIFGVPGGRSSDDLDAHQVIGAPEQCRVYQLYETLTGYDAGTQIEMRLAESVEPLGDGSVWEVKLKDGLTFHNGKPVTADDVLATLERIVNPSAPMSMASSLTNLDIKKSKVVDKRTAHIAFTGPFSILPELLADFKMGVVPRGYDPKKPVGAGPFMFKSYSPGRRSTFTKFTNYWRSGLPYIDELVIVDFPDEAARINAFLSGQIHATEGIPSAYIENVKKSSELRLLEAAGATWFPMAMRCDTEPFQDPRVREAFKLIVDREAMVEQAWSGHARVANDYYSPFDAGVVDLPQRQRDVAKAKSLLKAAGQENLQVELNTSEVMSGFVEMSQVFAEQARGIVDVKVKKVDPASYYGENYLKYPFAMENKFNRGFLRTAQQSSMNGAPFNSPHFNDKEFNALCNQAISTIDDTKRNGLIAQAQKIEYERGGWMIPCFINSVDGYAAKVSGFRKNKGSTPLDEYGFAHVGFAE